MLMRISSLLEVRNQVRGHTFRAGGAPGSNSVAAKESKPTAATSQIEAKPEQARVAKEIDISKAVFRRGIGEWRVWTSAQVRGR